MHSAGRANERVLAYLKDLSAHSDIVDVLLEAVHPLGDVELFCPDHAQYRYVLASTSDWPAVDVRFWARQAYVHARSSMVGPVAP